MDRALVVLNPSARRGGGSGHKRQLEEALRKAGVSYDLVETTGPGHARALAREGRARDYFAIVVAGGDGTVNEVVNGMAEAASPGMPLGRLALFPTGTGNDLAHSLGCSHVPIDVAAAIAGGRTRRIDVGLVQARGSSGAVSRYFANNVGIGLEASVTLESYRIKRLPASMIYLVAALRSLRQYSTPWADMVWETSSGRTETAARRITLISIGNSMRAGGGFLLTPDALPDDGLFDAAIADALSRRRVLMLLPKALVGKHTGDPAVQMIRCHWFKLRVDEPLPVHLDGEVVIKDAVELETVIEPGRLEIMI